MSTTKKVVEIDVDADGNGRDDASITAWLEALRSCRVRMTFEVLVPTSADAYASFSCTGNSAACCCGHRLAIHDAKGCLVSSCNCREFTP